MKNIIILALLCVGCESYYAAMKNVQSTCVILIKSRNCSDTERRICRNIQRLQKASFKKMSACGLFIIDTTLLIQLLSFITFHIIVYLQLTYL
ncbi:hypothetical protein PYW08_009426 [Mythimna loreyi]|uniref:Uncharacterized protein n=1 Tax=Mythimna loreyi TaxID=667449 RepID=A0ACC2QB84_9NEOP|nr:hypothetical protein PYW08_009426 [Mythimna loreyi]